MNDASTLVLEIDADRDAAFLVQLAHEIDAGAITSDEEVLARLHAHYEDQMQELVRHAARKLAHEIAADLVREAIKLTAWPKGMAKSKGPRGGALRPDTKPIGYRSAEIVLPRRVWRSQRR